ncbi:MAG: hypothetical protein J0L70_26570 [Leptolyngbya sp. UWPOB_LEPTO1]|uniref:hypothetical protein n=1 Tax=Leptolyngbya sp. UWPOB_LEPTO1 TaxID=2815653 RepID=UPI001AD5EC4F|nr:hypothetical protein [Leptolyngbya sp. UWPOB_LEPTO1]MBN8564105.1 hypothetical protein [Leptolyngbya sp. UWPOB_LEPTO1]
MNNRRTKITISLIAGFIFTGIATTGHLHGKFVSCSGGQCSAIPDYQAPEAAEGLEYQPGWAIIKVPAALLAVVAFAYAWAQAEQLKLDRDKAAIRRKAELGAYGAAAQMQAAEQYYEEFAPYLEVDAAEVSDSSTNPSNDDGKTIAQVQGSPESTSAPVATATQPFAWRENFLEYPALIYGGMGAGKSWTVRDIVRLKVEHGHQVVVLDPHAASREWQGVQHIGAGMNYRAIGEYLDRYLHEIAKRYQDFNQSNLSEETWQAQLRARGEVISVVCEEMTNWADRVNTIMKRDITGEFFKCGMSDSRKVLMPPLFVAHDRTLSCLGDAKGLAKLRDAALMELELIPKIDPSTKKPVASGQGWLKLPGHKERLGIQLPPQSQKITTFTAPPTLSNSSAVEESDLWERAKQRLQQAWKLPPVERDAPAVFTPSDLERTSALVNALQLLMKFDRIDAAKQIKSMLEDEPNHALWIALKSLGLGVTAASREVFGFGSGGSNFQNKAKPWYAALERQFGQIKE